MRNEVRRVKGDKDESLHEETAGIESGNPKGKT